MSATGGTALARLLGMYPVSALREAWASKKGVTKEDLIAEVVAQRPEKAIFEFCRVYHPQTKQRVLLYENLAGNLSPFQADPLIPMNSRKHVERTAGAVEEFYCFDLEYLALVGPPYIEQALEFLWPVTVVAEPKHILLRFTIIEKSISTYLPPGKSAYNVRKAFDEEMACTRLISGLSDPSSAARCDIHKGVKALWSSDQIDAHHGRWKTANSTDSKIMDAKHLMKRDNPTAFKEAMASPLLKTVFQNIGQAKFPPIFATSPGEGEIAVNRYSSTLTEVDNVVRAILAAN